MMLYYNIIVFSSLLTSTQAFYGSQILSFITSKDYTHSDLVEIGILQAAAKFFEKVRVPWKPTEPPPGSLSGISDVTARKLYDKYYGADVSSHKFQMVMDQISRHNLMVDQTYSHQAHWHFNAEKIREGNEKLKELRNYTLSILKSSNPDYDAARILIGQFLHVVQDFYSNSNWVEMTGGAAIYEDLGIDGKTLQGIAGPTVDTCTNCGTLLMPCALFGALIQTNLLTSGYRNGQGNATKPQKDPNTNIQGKCSHGGMFDTTWNISAATGGVNKETNTLEYSPLFGDHNKAALLAIEHTRQFFINSGFGLLTEIGQDKFMTLLELYAGNPMAFVVDTSSADMLDGIKKFVQDVVSNVTGSVITPTNYILVTVDTSTNKTTLRQSKNATDIQTWLNGVTLPQVGSCAQFAIEGLQKAVVAAGARSKIYVFSDSAPTNPGEIHFITSISTTKEVSINFLTDSSCTHRKKRGIRAMFLPLETVGRWRRSVVNPHLSTDMKRAFRIIWYKATGNDRNTFPVTTLHKGEKVVMEVRILDSRHITTLSKVQLTDSTNHVIASEPVNKKKSVRGETFHFCALTIPKQKFKIKLVGKLLSKEREVMLEELYAPE